MSYDFDTDSFDIDTFIDSYDEDFDSHGSVDLKLEDDLETAADPVRAAALKDAVATVFRLVMATPEPLAADDAADAKEAATEALAAPADDVMSFDASDMAPASVEGVELSDDDFIEAYLLSQAQAPHVKVVPPQVIRSRRKRAAVANDAQMLLFA